MKTTQVSESQDRNNCTVLALKSVTGWDEQECQSILAAAGRRRNHGFDIESFIENNGYRILDAKFERVYAKLTHERYYHFWSEVYKRYGIEESNQWDRQTKYAEMAREDWKKFKEVEKQILNELGYTDTNWGSNGLRLKKFAEQNPKGVFYVVAQNHALAVIDGVIVDNLQGTLAGKNRHIVTAYKVTGNINPNKGITTVLDVMTKKRHKRLFCGETVIYVGHEPLTSERFGILAKHGDRFFINTQQGNGLVVAKFGTPVSIGPNGKKTCSIIEMKIPREFVDITPERESYRENAILKLYSWNVIAK